MFRLLCLLCLVVPFGVASGCSDSAKRAELAEATGIVTYNGTPLPHGRLAFHPENGRSASATIEDGAIVSPSTYEAGDGLPVGMLKVTVSALDNPQADMYTPTKSLIPARYGNPNHSGLQVEIQPGQNTLTLELTD